MRLRCSAGNTSAGYETKPEGFAISPSGSGREVGTHDRCAGSSATSECICWHHVLQQRHVGHALELLVQIEQELESIGNR